MKSVLNLLLALLISSTAHAQYKVGDVVSDFTLQSYDGGMISLFDYSGDVVLLTFWWFGCPPCVDEAPDIQTELWEKYKGRNFQVLSIGVGESLDNAALWVGLFLITHLVVIDEGSVFDSYSPASIFPHNSIIGSDGRLLYSEIAFDLETLDEIIESNTVLVSIDDERANIPDELTLHPAYPNPFNPSTTISFDLNVRSTLNLKIFDQLGREIITLFSGTLERGQHSYIWTGKDKNGKKVSSGIYFSQLQAGDLLRVRKVTLLK
ncbi:MAG: redoxin domain-containing protein [Candidatus Marinimicrobia bacterium]|nr:redoxin domain-containing protein [Candidatus Neomarinimicrobiota bacterium]